jgi:hypothetical protein
MARLLLILCVVSGAAVTAAPQVLVPAGDINTLKRDYPFVRFSQLIPQDAAVPPGHRTGSSASSPAAPQSLVPPGARAFDNRRVSIRGYVVPVDVTREGTREFVLSSNIDSCHFGIIGGPEEWVYVTMAEGRAIPHVATTPVTVFGVLSVGEQGSHGIVDSVYRMRGERVAVH